MSAAEASRLPAPAQTTAAAAIAQTPGAPLEREVRRDLESRLGFDFGSVRIHTGTEAAESARGVNALAYTVGSHIVFGERQFAPSTPAGRHLLAHELTHTIQQRSGLALQRQDASGAAPAEAAELEADRAADSVAAALLVEDDAFPGAGQMRKTEFLDELQRASCTAADAELARVGRSTEGCPYVERAFSRYRTMTAARIERSIHRYVDAAGVTSASGYIPLVSRRVAEGVTRWATTGEVSGVPPELAGEALGGGGVLGMAGGLLGGLAGGLAGGIGRMLFKRAAGGEATPADVTMAASSLGRGVALDGGVRGRMENAFSYDFSRVRVHADSPAATVSSSLGARAFTLGGDIAFGAGEYRPNTLTGDALIAHELAHVVQQSSRGSASAAVEEDADHSAVHAMVSVWSGAKGIARNAMPRLRSGLGLQRCSSTPARPTTPPAAAPRMTCTTVDPAQWSTAVTAAQALTDVTAKAAAMTALAQQALCELNIHVAQARTSSTSTVEAADYEPNPTINFDVNLNNKRYEWTEGTTRHSRSLAVNGGFTFNRGGPPNYSMIGPRAIDANQMLDVRLFAQHELGIAGESGTGADAETRVWAEDFRRYFHQYIAFPLDRRPTWEKPGIYYQAASAAARATALQTYVQYFQNPPAGVDADRFRSAFRQWMRRRRQVTMPDINGIPTTMRGQTLDSQLMIDLNAALPAAAP